MTISANALLYKQTKTFSTVIKDCPFCTLPAERIIDLGYSCVLGLRDGYPVSEGHTLIIPRRHIATWFDATPAERMELWSAVDTVCQQLQREFEPDGFNFGINSGEAAGQTVPHLHLHVIPRYTGDMDDPRGGVRHVIPWMGNYKLPSFGQTSSNGNLIADGQVPRYESQRTIPRSLITNSGTGTMLDELKEDISNCDRLDIAVAFVFRSGLNCLRHHIVDLLDKQGKLRLLTGDYLNATEPDALQDLLDIREDYPDQCEFFIYQCRHSSFHPKSYLLFKTGGENVAYVGSSNLSQTALTDGVEWNLRVSDTNDDTAWQQVVIEFEDLIQTSNVQHLTYEWIQKYREKLEEQRQSLGSEQQPPVDNEAPQEPTLPPVIPNELQREALTALAETRATGNRAGLVVMATGLGKTWLAAFDVDSDKTAFKRVLFVAHREEILAQSLRTFRLINPTTSMGVYNGKQRDVNTSILFASIQTLSRTSHLQKFHPNEFDYIVVDEFHHAAANTYRRLIDYFRPNFLLGLTATPERTDGGDLLTLCDQNLVYRCDLTRGINKGLLSTFQYYGVADNVNYENIPWRSRKFDEKALTQAVETIERAKNIYDQWKKRGKDRTLAFCVSKSHANYMRGFFKEQGVRCAAVHSGIDSDPRALSLEGLESGELQIVFAIDMFNEGVDMPALDTIMMLRPSESAIIWLQQFGRGLRKQGEKVLTVIDYIGNHRSFLVKLKTLFGMQQANYSQLRMLLEKIRKNDSELPEGCGVSYELEAIDILKQLLPNGPSGDALLRYYKDFRELHGQRPTATEALHDGYAINSVMSTYGSWLEFVSAQGDLNATEQQLFEEHSSFFKGLQAAKMNKSYKMVLLRALLNLNALPGNGASLDQLAETVTWLTSRSSQLAADFGDALTSNARLKTSLKQNPINAWTGSGAFNGPVLFDFDANIFRYKVPVDDNHRDAFQALARELIEWRLSVYLSRTEGNVGVNSF